MHQQPEHSVQSFNHRFAEARGFLIEHYGELAQLEPEVLFLW